MNHHFSIDIAEKHGVNEAIFLENISYWIFHNKANRKHYYDDRYWTYNSQKAFEELFPYWSRQNLRTIIKSCINQELIIKGTFNKSNYDHTHWYSLTDKALKLFNRLSDIGSNQPVESPKSTSRLECGLAGENNPQALNNSEWLEPTHQRVETHQPIPYINTDNKQQIKIKDNAQPEKMVAVVILPEWINNELWEDFKQFRKELKKPMTELMQKKMINRLEKMRSEGQNVEDVLNQSMANGWQGVFEIKSTMERNYGNQQSKVKSAAQRFWDRNTAGLPEYEKSSGKREISSDTTYLSSATDFLF
jgi:hypothetical protein